VDDTVSRDANVNGRDRHVLVGWNVDDQGDPAWSPEGRALAYFDRSSDTIRIVVRWPKTGRVHVLRSIWSRSLEPTWSPDAKHIAVTELHHFSTKRTGPDLGIVTVSVATNKWRQVTNPPDSRYDAEP